MSRNGNSALCLLCVLPILSCSGARPPGLGVSGGRLSPCPSSPNCVSSDAPDAGHRVEAFVLDAAPDIGWRALREEIAALPRTTVVAEEPNYLHAQCASAVFGFVDDLEVHLPEGSDKLAIRSASRVGSSDLGVNRRRVERLREALRARGVVR
ncbi:MAG TPA: DUF1499 domain-containing protein [Deferrisomatales bacterium]|nr:DUF1499 domain-containing protein [Deferrisomatales bacterium]